MTHYEIFITLVAIIMVTGMSYVTLDMVLSARSSRKNT